MASSRDEYFMRKCLKLASKGGRSVRPNPMVGCVVVKDENQIATGWHQVYGGPHAEIRALTAVGQDFAGATLYVNLEPCNHHGKTPPCTESIIREGIGTVVIGMRDPNPEVLGKGLERLASAGISIRTDVLLDESRLLNRVYLVNVIERRPFITVKVAQSFDGFIAAARSASGWFTSDESRHRVHVLRSEHDAVMVGGATIRADNPRLTVRHARGRQPLRIVVSGSLRLPLTAHVFSDGRGADTIILTTIAAKRSAKELCSILASRGVRVIAFPGRKERIDLRHAAHVLLDLGVHSLIVEGGAAVFTRFLAAGMADEVQLFQSPALFREGLPAFRSVRHGVDMSNTFTLKSVTVSGEDIHAIYHKRGGY